MSAARGILARLPLEILVPLLWRRPNLLGPEPATVRAAIVNGLDRQQLRELLAEQAGSLYETFDLYLKICTFQGELSEFGLLFIGPEYLLARATQLRDPEWFRYFSAFSPGAIDLDQALQGPVEIQARALAWCSLRSPTRILAIKDFGLVFQGRPALRRWYLRELETMVPRLRNYAVDDMPPVARALGYLGWGSPARASFLLQLTDPADSDDSYDYFPFYLQNYIQGRRDRGEVLDFQGLAPVEPDGDLVAAGYLPSHEDLPHFIEEVMDWFQVDLLQPGDMDLLRANDHIVDARNFSAQEILRVPRMLAFCQANGGAGPLYTTSLLILAGQGVSTEVLTEHYEDFEQLLLTVAHPQVDEKVDRQIYPQGVSSVLYDPVGLVSKLGPEAPEIIQERVFALGQALPARSSFQTWRPGQTPFEEAEKDTVSLNSVLMEYAAHYRKSFKQYYLPALSEEMEAINAAARKAPGLLQGPLRELALAPEDLESSYRQILGQLQAEA